MRRVLPAEERPDAVLTALLETIVATEHRVMTPAFQREAEPDAPESPPGGIIADVTPW